MSKLVCVVALVLGVVACDRKMPENSAAETLGDYKGKEKGRPSLEGMRYYAMTESRMRPAEDELKDLSERIAAGLKVSPEKARALDALRAEIAKARPLIEPLKTAGALDWEKMKEGVEPVVVSVEQLLVKLRETP